MHKKIVKKLSDIAMFQLKYVTMVELAHAHHTFERVKKQNSN